MSWMLGELQVGFRQQKHFDVKLHLMLPGVPPLTGTGQWCHCHQPPNPCVPTTARGRCRQAPTGSHPFHAFAPTKHHQNDTPPSALHEVLACDGISILRAWHGFPGSKPAGGLGKEEKLLPPRRASLTQDPSRTLRCSVSLYGGAGSQAGSADNIWGSEVADGCQSVLIQVRGTQPKGAPARVVGA